MNIIRRVAVRDSSKNYDKGGFKLDVSKWNIRLPEILEPSNVNKFFVPLLFKIKRDGSIYDVAVEDDFSKSIIFNNCKLTRNASFEVEAINALRQSGKWEPFTFKNNYVDREGRILIRFEYHPEYIKDLGKTIVLNPDVYASFNGNMKIYNDLVFPRNGYDGQITFLVIIEKDGTITNEYCLRGVGKINCKVGLFYLRKLSEWTPAFVKGEAVRSQFEITISR